MKVPVDRALSDYDLMKYVKQLRIPHFRGIYMRDTLPKKARDIECWILNHDLAKSTGTHWTALVKVNCTAWYFDSFGRLIPPLEVKKYLGSQVKILYNYNQFQNFNTFVCGQLCLVFLCEFWQNYINSEHTIET